MNLLCPNCQKMLTVPEQYAGQLMKCPLCSGTFTVPALPPGGNDPAPEPPALPTSQPSSSPAKSSSEESVPAFAASAPPASTPSPEVPAFAMGAPATSSPPTYQTSAPSPQPRTTPSPSITSTAPPRATTSPATPSEGYTNVCAVYFSEKIIQWIPLAAIVLIFFLQWFDWVGIYPGGVRAQSQNAWYAAFGWTTPDKDMKAEFPVDDKNETVPSVDALILFYLIPFFLVTFVATIAVAALPYIKVPIPPQVQQLLPWKWAILAGLNAVMLLFLGLQVTFNFPLETVFTKWVENRPEFKKLTDEDTKGEKKLLSEKGKYLAWAQRTVYWRITFWLHVLATLASAYIYWMEKRGPGKPLPKLELQW